MSRPFHWPPEARPSGRNGFRLLTLIPNIPHGQAIAHCGMEPVPIPRKNSMHIATRAEPRSPSGAGRSISDDDLCSECSACSYRPGETSSCAKGWPTSPSPDGYITSCAFYASQERRSQ